MTPRCLVVATSVTLVGLAPACGDGGAKDASVDIDNGSCGDQLRYTGEYVDWDVEAAFCGIKDAVLEVDGGGAMDSTAPNGRFDLCLPAANKVTRLDITPAAANSECSRPISNYTLPTIILGNASVIHAGGFTSARSMTVARQASFFTQIGQTFDASRAQVHVHVNGMTPRKVTLASDHGAPQIVSGTAWIPGEVGADIFFPNVAVGTGTTKLTIEGGGVGAGDITVIAGTLTNVAVIAN